MKKQKKKAIQEFVQELETEEVIEVIEEVNGHRCTKT
jgi:hypothetical protein